MPFGPELKAEGLSIGNRHAGLDPASRTGFDKPAPGRNPAWAGPDPDQGFAGMTIKTGFRLFTSSSILYRNLFLNVARLIPTYIFFITTCSHQGICEKTPLCLWLRTVGFPWQRQVVSWSFHLGCIEDYPSKKELFNIVNYVLYFTRIGGLRRDYRGTKVFKEKWEAIGSKSRSS